MKENMALPRWDSFTNSWITEETKSKQRCRICEGRLDKFQGVYDSGNKLVEICRDCFVRIKNSNLYERNSLDSVKERFERKFIHPSPNEIWEQKDGAAFVIIDKVENNTVTFSRYYVSIKERGHTYDTSLNNFLSRYKIYDTNLVIPKEEYMPKGHRVIEI